MHKYNNYFPDDATAESLPADRERMLRQQFGKVGKGVFIEPPLSIDYGCNIALGEDFYANFKYVDEFLCTCHSHSLTHSFTHSPYHAVLTLYPSSPR